MYIYILQFSLHALIALFPNHFVSSIDMNQAYFIILIYRKSSLNSSNTYKGPSLIHNKDKKTCSIYSKLLWHHPLYPCYRWLHLQKLYRCCLN